MNIKDAAIEIEENLLAAPPNAFDDAILQRPRRFSEPAARHAQRGQRSMLDGFAGDERRDRPHHRFHFGKFRHVLRYVYVDNAVLNNHPEGCQFDVFVRIV